jgi:hypothetical protein
MGVLKREPAIEISQESLNAGVLDATVLLNIRTIRDSCFIAGTYLNATLLILDQGPVTVRQLASPLEAAASALIPRYWMTGVLWHVPVADCGTLRHAAAFSRPRNSLKRPDTTLTIRDATVHHLSTHR